MAFVKIWIHLIWTTKRRQPLLIKGVKTKVINHIKDNAIKKDIFIDSIGGGKEHLHLLISLGTKQTISELVMLLQGESSFWINSQKMIKGKFAWQHEYFAVSVSVSALPAVRKYIRNQEEHHQRKHFHKEYVEILKKCGFHNELG